MNTSTVITPTHPTATSQLASAGNRPGGQRWPRIWGPRLWKLGAFGLGLFLYRLWVIHHSGISLFFDEAQYWDWSRHLDWGFFSKPPLIAGLIWLSTALFGHGVIGVKLLTMALYPIAGLCMVGLARALWPTSSGVRSGMVAAAVFLTLPMTGLLGLVASTDAPLILCWTLAAWALWRAQVTNRMPYWVAVGAAVGLGMMSKYTMAAFGITAIWAIWAIPGPRRGLLRVGPWVALAVAALCIAPNVLWNMAHGYPTLQHTADITTDSSREGGLLKALVFVAGQLAMLGPVTVVAGIWLWRSQLLARMSQAAQGSGPIGASTIWRSSIQSTLGVEDALRPGSALPKQSALYLASVSSYRYLWALSLPLQLIAIAQAINADAHVNWAAPSMVGFTLLIASRLSQPLVSMSTPRPTRWLTAVLASNLLLVSVVLHLKDVAGDTLPSKFDVLVRMRGWDEAFRQMTPALNDPIVRGLPVLTHSRLMITQSAYNLRDQQLETMIWNPAGSAHNHYEMTRSLPNKVGQDVLLITDQDTPPQAILSRFAIIKELHQGAVNTGPDRSLKLSVFFLRGFLGYDEHSYQEQSGAGILPRDDVPH
jgi:4-amino-4-deoxy-L-arabinose transferase-like glycosyltransferase